MMGTVSKDRNLASAGRIKSEIGLSIGLSAIGIARGDGLL
jgi:hypothetical protein